jgi:uncharacterized OB-fold protein
LSDLVTVSAVPQELWDIVARHGEVVAANDQQAILADFRPDRVGQLIASARLPAELVGSELLHLERQPDGLVAAFIRYTATSGEQVVLRSRWVQLPEGWRVTQVRNLPDTPPDLGTAGPADDGLDRPHWEGLRAGVLRIQRCTQCAQWVWAPRPLCPHCHSWELEWPAVDPRGTVFSWTRTWQPFSPAVSGHLPYVVVLVELDDAGGRRVLGALTHADGVDPRIGQPVRGRIEPSATGGWPLLRWELA